MTIFTRMYPNCIEGYDYDYYLDMIYRNQELIHREMLRVPLCNELYAKISNRTVFNDRKVMAKENGSYKITDIKMIGSNIKNEFIGIYHSQDLQDRPDYYLRPYYAIELQAAVEAYIANSLETMHKYDEDVFAFSAVTHNNKVMLKIEYDEGREITYLDKYRARKFNTILKNVLATSVYRY